MLVGSHWCRLLPNAQPRAESAGDELYRDHVHWLRAALRRRFGAENADDYAQETYLRATRNAPPDSLARPRAWLMMVALNVAREAHRYRAVRSPDALQVGVTLESVEFSIIPEQSEALLLKQIIQSLPPKLRDVFVLSRFEGLTYPEIAQRCNISVKTVEWRMTKALAICTARLKD